MPGVGVALCAAVTALGLFVSGGQAAPPPPSSPSQPVNGKTQPGGLSHLGKQGIVRNAAVGSATVRSSSQATNNCGGSTTPAAPTGLQAADRLVVIQFSTSSTGTAPAGWATVGTPLVSDTFKIHVWTAPGSVTGAYSFGDGGSGACTNVILLDITGADPDFAINAMPQYRVDNASAAEIAPSVTPTIDNALLISGAVTTGLAPRSYTPDSRMVERGDISVDPSAGNMFSSVDTQTLVGGVNTATGTRTLTADDTPVDRHSAVTLAVGPPQQVATSVSWSGYAVPAGSSPFNEVETTYTQPAVTCPTSDAWTLFWAGLDGTGTAGSLEQAGTAAKCVSGVPTYFAWWELVPTYPVEQFSGFTITPGDQIQDKVTYNSVTAQYTLAVNDLTTGLSASHTEACATGVTCSNASAEAIVERAHLLSGTGEYPLANYNTMRFTGAKAGTSTTTPQAFGGYSGLTPVNMTSDDGTRTLAAVSPMDVAGLQFTDNWKAAS